MKLHKSENDKEIYYYFLKSGAKRWLYRHKYRDSLGNRREKKKSGFKSEKKALRSLSEVRASTLNGQTRHIEHSQMTVSEWLDIWYETKNRNWAITTQVNREMAIRRHLKPLIGNRKLSTLSRTEYESEFINKLLDKGFKPNTVIVYHDIFKIAVNAAVEDEILQRNRFSKIVIQRDKKLENFLNPEELNTFLRLAKGYGNDTSYTLVLFLAYTGVRRGEAMGIKWKNICFKKNTITVESTRDDKGFRSPKTKNSHRTIEVDEILITQLKKYQRWCIEKKLFNGMQLDKQEDFVFISYKSAAEVNSHYINRHFTQFYKRIKADGIDLKRITPHGLRHTHATILINKRVAPTTIADRLGNTVEMIYNVYSHSFLEIEDKAVSAFGESIAFGG